MGRVNLDPTELVKDLVQRILDGKLTRIRLGPKFARTALTYIQMAEDLFEPEQEQEAREWVREQLRGLAAGHDIRWLPDWIETPVEDLAINLVVDLGWELLHSSVVRQKLVRSAGSSAVRG